MIVLSTGCAVLFLALGSLYFPSAAGIGVAADRMAAAASREQGMEKVIFTVRCYDEGKAALQGMKGIQRIETGFHHFYEADTVFFDPSAVTIENMEAALKRAGTYVETIRQKERQ